MGGMAEWTIASALKADGASLLGSNPSPTAFSIDPQREHRPPPPNLCPTAPYPKL